MANRIADPDYGQLRSVRREKQRRLNNQDRPIRQKMLEEERTKSATRRKANRQVKMDRVIGYIQAVADECAVHEEETFDDFDALVSHLAKRGVMSWPRTRLSEPTHEERIFISEAIRQAQSRGLISVLKVGKKQRKIINHFPTLPCHGFISLIELGIIGKQARRQLQAA